MACFSKRVSCEPRREKTILRGFQPCLTYMLTGLYSHRRWLEAFGFRKKRACTIYVAKTKALIRCAVTAQLICAFVFAYAKISFSHDADHIIQPQSRSITSLYSKTVSTPAYGYEQYKLIIMIIILSIFKEDSAFSILASLPFGPPVNTDIDYYYLCIIAE